MVVLTVITNSNDHTVYFEEPLENFQCIKLLSCSLYNSWKNLKKNGEITITDYENQAKKNYLSFHPGHYTPESMLYLFKKINYFSKINSPQGILVFPNTEKQNMTELTQIFTDCLILIPKTALISWLKDLNRRTVISSIAI